MVRGSFDHSYSNIHSLTHTTTPLYCPARYRRASQDGSSRPTALPPTYAIVPHIQPPSPQILHNCHSSNLNILQSSSTSNNLSNDAGAFPPHPRILSPKLIHHNPLPNIHPTLLRQHLFHQIPSPSPLQLCSLPHPPTLPPTRSLFPRPQQCREVQLAQRPFWAPETQMRACLEETRTDEDYQRLWSFG